MSVNAYEAKFRALSRYATQLCFSPQERIRRFVKGLRSELRISALQVAATAKSFQEVVDFVIEVEGVKPDDFTMATTSKRFRKGGEFNGSYSRGQGSGGYSVRPIQSSLQTVVGGPPQTVQHFSERPMLTLESVMDVERLDILGGIVQNRVVDPQWLEVEVDMVEAVILEDVVVEVMVVTKTAGVMGKLEPLHHNMVGATDR